jgi:Flp pilus assembly protein TadD
VVQRVAMRAHPRAALLAILLAAACASCQGTPDLAEEHLRRGDKALAEGRYAESLTAYRHAYELAPHDPRVQRATMRARVHVLAETPARVQSESLDDTRYEAELLLDQDKGREAVCLTAIANALARRGDVEGAKLKLVEALKHDPTSAVAHAARGALLLATNARGEARAELEAALRTKPDFTPALATLGQVLLAEGDLPAAVEKLSAALRGGDDFAVRLALGNARLAQQRAAEAVPHLTRAAELDPKSADAASLLGQALLAAGRFADAERALRAATQLRADEPATTALGFALLRQKKSEQALGVFRRMLAEDATLASARYGAAAACDELGRREEALADYRRLLALPTEGRQKAILIDLRPEAERRVAALVAEEKTAASASPSAAPAPSAKKP